MHGRQPTRRVVAYGDLVFRAICYGHERDDVSAVVLVHGIGVSHRYFSSLRRSLARTRTVVCIDMPGFGGLPKPHGAPDVVTTGAALANVIASSGLGPVVLVGHSMGAQWAVEAALHRPDLVERVVAVGPVTDADHRNGPAQTRALALDALLEPPWISGVVLAEYVRCGIRWYLDQLRHMLDYALEERVAELQTPLLVIRGARDPVAGLRWCRLLRDRAPHADLIQVPGHHHAVHQSAPRAVASAIAAHAVGATGSHA